MYKAGWNEGREEKGSKLRKKGRREEEKDGREGKKRQTEEGEKTERWR